MGILGKLFDKKQCDICGGDIGLLGNRKHHFVTHSVELRVKGSE